MYTSTLYEYTYVEIKEVL